jgi:hypothetical protein
VKRNDPLLTLHLACLAALELLLQDPLYRVYPKATISIQVKIDQKQLEDVKYFKCFDSIVKNNARCSSEIKARIAMEKAAFNRKKNLFTSKLDLNLRTKLVKYYFSNTAFYGAKCWTPRKIEE